MRGEIQQFSSTPKAVASTRKKYRDVDDTTRNLMFDKRVVRGNTYASLLQPQPDMAEVTKQREAQKRRLARANQTRKRVGTPDPISGRKHMDVQTDAYLEELTAHTVEFEAETQTDFLLDRPPSPLFMPAKIGVDIETQIEDGELFDFDVEVEPLLEVLVGKTLEQSMMEVLEEEELESLRRHQEDFEKRRNAELIEVQRMEAAEKRRQDETERRMRQMAIQREQDLSMMRKVCSRSIARAHLASLKDRALAQLRDAGAFADGMQLAVESAFMPNLLDLVSRQIQQKVNSEQIVANIVQDAAAQLLDSQAAVLAEEKQRLRELDALERQARQAREQEILRRERERARIEAEQQCLMEWEQQEPPPPPPDVLEDEGLAVLGDGTDGQVAPEDHDADADAGGS